MRFVCDSCRAQYMISDDKVGAKGVKVRCKKCGYNIVVRPAGAAPTKDEVPSSEASESTASSQEQSSNEGFGLPPTLGTPPEGGIFSGVEDDELGAVFDQVLNSGSHRIPAGEKVGDGPAKPAAVSDAGAAVRKLAEAETGSVKKDHEWFVAIDEKQVGPLSLEKVKDHWERGEVGPDSLCWRAGFSDWIPLSETTELASVLAPRPTKPVIVEPAPMEPRAPVASGPVESAFSAGGPSKAARSEAPVASGASASQDSGWKPSAASVLASLVKEENDALTKPAAKAAPVEEKPRPVASGLLDLPPPEPVAAPSPMRAETPAPAGPYLAPAPAAPAYAPQPAQQYAQPMPQAYGQPMPQQYAPPPGYGYPPAAPAPKPGGKGMMIGGAVLLALAVGGGVFFATRPSEQPGTAPATQQQVAQAPTTKPAELPPMPPPPAAVAQNAAGTPAAQPSTAPATAPTPTTAPAVAAATPATAPAATPTPPPAEPVKAVEQPKTEPTQVARAEVPAKRPTTTTSRPATSRPSNEDEEAFTAPPRNNVKPASATKSGGNADDEFDELFGTKKAGGSTKPEASANGRTAYIPPEPGGGSGASQERLGQSDIMQVVLANKPAIIKCVGEQKKKDPGLSGKLVMRWTIQTNGKTKNVSCQTAEFRSTYMATCISGLIKGWSFPKHKVQGEPIDFPFTF